MNLEITRWVMTNVWTVVLAGGSGKRLAAMTIGTPKQYWRPEGGRSLLDETFARIAPLTTPSRTTLVADRAHRPYLQSTAHARAADWVVYQPSDRGTAVGVLLSLGPMLDEVDDGIVVLTPSDHGISNPAAFRSGVRDATLMIERGVTSVVLFGVEPSAPVADYGWILPGSPYQESAEVPLRTVRGVTEKPTVPVAKSLFDAGALWNTMVLVARASALISLYETHLPHWVDVCARCSVLPLPRRDEFLQQQYAALPSADFSRDILTPAKDLAAYAWPSTIGWTDLGTPERLSRWLNSRVVPPCAVPA